MSTKSILNKTSRKKRDTMLSWSNTTTGGAQRTPAVGGLAVAGNSQAISVWCPTARDLVQFGGSSGTVVQEAMRTATTAYMVGLAEKVRIQSSSGLPWMWRRICFRLRGTNGNFQTPATSDTPTSVFSPYLETSSGYVRLWFNESVNNQQNTINNQLGILFRGASGVDWNDVMIAPVDARQVDLSFDKTWKLHSGNTAGVFTEKNLWHPMRKNLVYDDDESGEAESTTPFSVTDKRGMGDYYVVDIIQPGMGGTASDTLAISSTASMYWHEK